MYEQLGAEKANALIGFHFFSGCDAVEKFTRKFKDARTKSFLNSDLDVFKAFPLLLKHVNTEIMHNLKAFTPKVYSQKTLKSSKLTELCWDICLNNLEKQDIKKENVNVTNKNQKK